MRTLLINLTRFGDLLQSQPLVHELASEGHSVGVVCLDNFAAAAGLLADVEQVFPLRGGQVLSALDTDWRTALCRVQGFVDEVTRTFVPERVINLTSTPPGRLLARRFGEGLPMSGFGLDAFGFGANGTLWTAFFEAASRKRGCSPFNIVDVFRKAAGCGLRPPVNRLRRPDDSVVRDVAARLENSMGLPSAGGERRLVAVQLGASEVRRQWPATCFAQVGDALSRAGYTPVLVGSAAERPLAAQYAAHAAHAFVDCVGSTTLPELAALLSLSRLLLTNDTGTMHLAAGLGVPSVALFLATAQPWDTGPYLPGCLCLEPDMPCHPCGFGTVCPHDERCRTAIQPQTVLECALSILEATPVEHMHGARVWRSQWTAEPVPFMDLQALSDHEPPHARGGRTGWLRLQRYFYRQFLDYMDAPMLPASAQLFATAPNPAWAGALGGAERAALAAVQAQALGLLALVEQSGAMVLNGAPAPVGQRFLSAVHRLAALFEEPGPYGGFDALGRLWLSATQERGEDLAGVVRLATLLRQCLTAWSAALNTDSS